MKNIHSIEFYTGSKEELLPGFEKDFPYIASRAELDKYIKFYAEERLQERFHCKTPLEVRSEALSAETPTQYPIAENKRIEAYKAKWCA